MKTINCKIPDEIHKNISIEKARRKKKIPEIVVEALACRYSDKVYK